MKKIFKNFALLIIIFSIINCKLRPKETAKPIKPVIESNQNNLNRVWMLVEFQDFKKEELIKNKAQMNLTNLKSTTATMGCNTIGFDLKIDANKISFSKIIQTEMFCENNMKLENTFSNSLLDTFTFNLVGQQLILSNSKNEKMVFITQDWD